MIGVAARERTPIRIIFPAAEYAYGRAIREQIEKGQLADELETEIPAAGPARPSSQLAVPVLAGDRLMAVLYVESEQQCRFGYDHEDALVALCAQVGLAMCAAGVRPRGGPELTARGGEQPRAPLRVRHFGRDNSIFIDDDYLIKGVAGAIL